MARRRSFRKPSRRQVEQHRVARVTPAHGGWNVEFSDGMSIHVHRGHGRTDQWFAMHPMDLRHERRSPSPEVRKTMQYVAISAVAGHPVEFFIDSQDDVVAVDQRQEQKVMASRRKQQHLPGIEPGAQPVEIVIPTMDWEQIGGDMDPGTYGGTIATADGDHVELLKIMPVREYVGDKEAAEVGFPFWTKEAWFDLDDLDPKDDDVKSALQTAGFSEGDQQIWFEDEATPEQRAIVIAEALLDYGRGDEGPSGWSGDLPDHKVKWWNKKIVPLPEYLADEDEAFASEVLLADLDIDHEGFGPEKDEPTNGLKVTTRGSTVEITEWTDIEAANGEEQPEGEKIVKQSATVDLEELIGPGKHVGAYSGFRKAVTLAELAQMDPEDQEKTIVAAAIAYLAYFGGEEEFVDAIGD